MTDGLDDRAKNLLEEAERGLDSLSPLEGASEDDVYDALGESNDLLSSAEEARALLSTTESRALLEALGLAQLPDGREAETLPEALTRGESERVADLQVLLKLARVADAEHDGGDLEDAIEDLRDAVDRRGADAGRTDDDRTDEDCVGERTGDEGDRADGDVERADEHDGASDDGHSDEEEDDRPDDETRADDADSKAEGDSGESLEEELRSTVSDAFEGFGDDVRDVRDRLEAATADDEADGEGEGDEAESDEESEVDEADGEGEGDDSMLDDAFDSEDATSRNPTTYSTMAPRPSDRADMRVSTRYSTMPDR